MNILRSKLVTGYTCFNVQVVFLLDGLEKIYPLRFNSNRYTLKRDWLNYSSVFETLNQLEMGYLNIEEKLNLIYKKFSSLLILENLMILKQLEQLNSLVDKCKMFSNKITFLNVIKVPIIFVELIINHLKNFHGFLN